LPAFIAAQQLEYSAGSFLLFPVFNHHLYFLMGMTKTDCIIVGAKNFSRNEYDGDTLKEIFPQMEAMRGGAPETAFCDRDFRGRKRVGRTTTVLPEVPAPIAFYA
jgi:hypothetical protein